MSVRIFVWLEVTEEGPVVQNVLHHEQQRLRVATGGGGGGGGG